jgi:NitT/TauT family transport system permease protein
MIARAGLYPAVCVVLIGIAWHLVTVRALVPPFLLPRPDRVAAAWADAVASGLLWQHLWPTLWASALGWFCGSLVALSLAALLAEFSFARRMLLWPLTGLQSIPKIALAPLVFLWAGFGLGAKVILVALICFFPVFANALAGFRAVGTDLADLLRAHGASRLYRFAVVSLPAALPAIMAGLEIAAAFALIGCVVMEFVGSDRGMGFLIQDASSQFDLPIVFAAVLTLGAAGLAVNAALRFATTRLVFWGQAARAAPAVA